MSFQLTRLRSVVLALAILLAAALVTQAAQPTFSDAATKTAAAKKRAKAKAKKRAAKRKAARKKARAQRKRMAGLKFYKPPKKIPAAHGKLIWQRKAGGLVPLRSASSTRLVLYTSKTTSGKSVAVSGSVSFPKGKAPKGGWPLITWGHSTTGIADKCAPSRITRSTPAGLKEGINYVDPVLNGWLDAGYAVARSDFRGLGTPGVHPYIHGISAGRDVLDMARVARQLGPKVSKRFLIGGHSQGGHAALFAAGLATKWTPELKLRGSAIYAPGSQFKLQADFLPALVNPNPLTALATMLFRGLSGQYPSLDPQAMLSDEVLPFYPDTDRKCLDEMMAEDHLGGIAPAKLFRAGLDKTELNRILEAQNPAVKTAAPVLLLQGDSDESTLKFMTDTLNDELNEQGSKVDYRIYNGLDHWSVVEQTRPDVLAFFKKRLPPGR